MVVTCLLPRAQAQVHLASPSVNKTYRELPLTLHLLSQFVFKTVTVTSPMFAKDEKLCTLERLKATLNNRADGHSVSSRRQIPTTRPVTT